MIEFIGCDSMSKGDWIGKKGTIGYYLWNTPDYGKSDIIYLFPSYGFISGGVDWMKSPISKNTALLIPDGTAHANQYISTNDTRLWSFILLPVYQFRGWLLASIYCLHAQPATNASISSYETIGGNIIEQASYTYEYDYSDGVWFHFLFYFQYETRFVMNGRTGAQGIFLDQYKGVIPGSNAIGNYIS